MGINVNFKQQLIKLSNRTFTDEDINSMQPFIINKVLSRYYPMLPYCNCLNKFTFSIPKYFWIHLSTQLIPGKLPLPRIMRRYKKTYPSWFFNKLWRHFKWSKREAKMYLKLISKQEISVIARKMGLNNKQLRQLGVTIQKTKIENKYIYKKREGLMRWVK